MENLYEYINKENWNYDSFSPNKAYVCSEISRLVYEYKPQKVKDRVNIYEIDQNTLKSENQEVQRFVTLLFNRDFRVIFIIETSNIITFGISFGRVVIVASRGTSYWKDWFINFNILKVQTFLPKLKLHKGFNNIAEISQYVAWSKIFDKPVPVYFTGHSLGGALSAVLFFKFKNENKRGINPNNIKSAYTFGMPRIANRNVVQFDKIYHFYNPLDVVPKVPMEVLGFSNLCPEYTFEANQIVKKDVRNLPEYLKSIYLFMTGKLIKKQHDILWYKDQIKKSL